MLYEYRANCRRSGKVDLRARSEMTNLQGFTSLYGYPRDTRDMILDQNSTRGLRDYPLYSDILYIDVDEDPEAEDRILAKLKSMNLGFKYFFSGKKGGHFHIELEPMEGVGIHDIQYQYVETMFKGADLNIYKTSGIIRIEGSRHKKNPGGFKKLLYSQEGAKLDLSEYKPRYTVAFPTNSKKDYTSDDLDNLEDILGMMMFNTVSSGGRHDYVYKLAAVCKDLEIDKMEAINKIHVWNNSMCLPPISGKDIGTTVNSAYRK